MVDNILLISCFSLSGVYKPYDLITHSSTNRITATLIIIKAEMIKFIPVEIMIIALSNVTKKPARNDGRPTRK